MMKFLITLAAQVGMLLILINGWGVDIEQVGVFKFVATWALAVVVLSASDLFKVFP